MHVCIRIEDGILVGVGAFKMILVGATMAVVYIRYTCLELLDNYIVTT